MKNLPLPCSTRALSIGRQHSRRGGLLDGLLAVSFAPCFPRVRAVLARWGWLLPLFGSLVVGHLLVWDRGLFKDDYREYAQAVDLMTGAWRPLWADERLPYFPVRFMRALASGILQGFVPQYTFAVRVVAAATAGIAALLLGGLVYRMLGSRLAGTVTTWLFAVPFLAAEAVFWLAAIGYVVGTILTLVFLHACWSALQRQRRAHLWMALGTTALVVAHLFYEVYVSAVLFIPVLAAVSVAGRPASRDLRATLKRTLLLSAWPACAIALFYLLILRDSAYAVRRGNLDDFGALSVAEFAERPAHALNQLAWWMASPGGGLGFTVETLQIGWGTLVGSWLGIGLALATLIAALLVVLTWTGGPPGEREVPPRVGLLVAGLGVAWLVAAALVPFIALGTNLPGARVLYFPLAGLAVTLGGLTATLSGRANPRYERLVVGCAGALLLAGMMSMLGHADVYAARWRLDREQTAAFVRAIPAEALPPDAFLVSLGVDDRLFMRPYAVAERATGVLERHWGMETTLQVAYHRPDLRASRGLSSWHRQFGFSRGLDGDISDVRIDDTEVPLDRVLAFTYRDGSIYLVEHLTIVRARKEPVELTFPLVERLHAAGLPTLPVLILDNEADGEALLAGIPRP